MVRLVERAVGEAEVAYVREALLRGLERVA
jgi:hypothetical protein